MPRARHITSLVADRKHNRASVWQGYGGGIFTLEAQDFKVPQNFELYANVMEREGGLDRDKEVILARFFQNTTQAVDVHGEKLIDAFVGKYTAREFFKQVDAWEVRYCLDLELDLDGQRKRFATAADAGLIWDEALVPQIAKLAESKKV